MMAKKLGYSIREQLLVFIHDFTEAYCGDVNTDLKNLLPEYKRIEKEVELAVYGYLGINPPTEEEKFKIKVVDYTMLVVEMRDITCHNHLRKIEELEDYIAVDILDEFKLHSDVNIDDRAWMVVLNIILDHLLELYKNEYNN
jgi:hypothetical protein